MIGQSTEGTVFRDVISLALLGFVAMVVLMLPHLNPPGQKKQEEVRAPGDVIFQLTWPDGQDMDIDQWVRAPGSISIGYSNKGGPICNLLRDDLGMHGDPLQTNHEITVCRGIIPGGEYSWTVHFYAQRSGKLPVPVQLAASVRTPTAHIDLFHTALTLRLPGIETTVARFRLTEEGTLVPGSLHSTDIALRSGYKQ